MPQVYEGSLISKGKRYGIVVSRFNEFISSRLVEGAVDGLKRHGVKDDEIEVVRVPGSFEIPSVARLMTESKKYSAVICLGAVIRGATPHFDYIAAEVSKGIAQLGLHGKIPVVFGVITTDTIEQAIERAGTKEGNKGFEAAMTAIEMVNLYERLA